jgi:hypothetical protein
MDNRGNTEAGTVLLLFDLCQQGCLIVVRAQLKQDAGCRNQFIVGGGQLNVHGFLAGKSVSD